MIDRLVEFLSQFIGLFKFWYIIFDYERGVLLRLGRFRKEMEPGLHWLIPFSVDHVLADNVVPRTVHLGVQSLMTADGRTIAVSAVVTASIRHIRKAMLEVEGVDHALIDSCTAAVAAHVSAVTWDHLRTEDSGAALMKVCRAQAFRYGLEIHRVQLADMSPCRAIRLHSDRAKP